MITLDIDIPEGYEATGEFRPPVVGEWFIDSFHNKKPKAFLSQMNYDSAYIILRKKMNRWRAEDGELYWWFDCEATVMSCAETDAEEDATAYALGNYFRTKEQAEEASRRIHECLMSYHEEIGE